MMHEVLLNVIGLRTAVATSKGEREVVRSLSFSVAHGETVAIVGESGCGKSLTALSIMRLLPKGQARISGGKILLEGQDLAQVKPKRLQEIRGADISMIFQEPVNSLNPVLTIGEQLIEGIVAHQNVTRSEAKQLAIDLLRRVNLPDPETRFNEYPHRLSGGMCQRIGIAMAIASKPKLLIADEPTTALDVTIQAQILKLLKSLQTDLGMSMLFITHDFGVVREVADRVVVLYAGRKVEEGPVEEVFSNPRHPYTEGLLACTLTLGKNTAPRLPEIPGVVPDATVKAAGCIFAPRCYRATAKCFSVEPQLMHPAARRQVACWAVEEEKGSAVLAVGL